MDQVDIDDKPADEKVTTPVLENLLRAKYPRESWALFFNVPDAVSLDQRRRIDALAFGIWKSVGRDIHGFEFKVSRSDWLRELKQVSKADPFIALCDYFWLVTADTKLAKLEEIPVCWGWMTATKSGLRVQKPATKLPGCGDNIPRDFMLGVLRRMQDDIFNSPDVQSAIEQQVRMARDSEKSRIKFDMQQLERKANDLEQTIKDFEEKSGIQLGSWRFRDAGEIVRALQNLGYGSGLGHVPQLLESQEKALRDALFQVSKVREQLAKHQQQPVEKSE